VRGSIPITRPRKERVLIDFSIRALEVLANSVAFQRGGEMHTGFKHMKEEGGGGGAD